MTRVTAAVTRLFPALDAGLGEAVDRSQAWSATGGDIAGKQQRWLCAWRCHRQAQWHLGQARQARQDESGTILHRRMDEMVMRQTHLETDVSFLKHKVDAHDKITGKVTTMVETAKGAGMMGHGLLTAGGWCLARRGGSTALTSGFTARPPP